MNRIKEYRGKINLTQDKLAKHLSMSQSAIAHYENGKRRVDLDTCRRITQYFIRCGLKVSMDDIFPPKQKSH